MHSDQIDIDIGTARALIGEQFPRFHDEPLVALPSAGTVNAIVRIGDSHAARFPLRLMDPALCAGLLEAEARAGAEFHHHCPVPSPLPVGIGRPGAGYPMPWLVQSWVEGQMATPIGLSAAPEFARDLAGLVASLRQAGLHGRTFDGQGRGGHLPDHDDWMKHCLAMSEGLLDVDRLGRMWGDMRCLPETGAEVMSHKDLIPPNLLVWDGWLVGVLDTGGFGPADPGLDLVVGWHLLDRECRQLFRDALQVGELEWRRVAAWAFQQAMGLVWYYQHTNPMMSELGRSTLSRLLEAHEE